jgi:hypothetical protein
VPDIPSQEPHWGSYAWESELQHGEDPTAWIGIRATDNPQLYRDAHPSRKEKRSDTNRNRSSSVATESSQNALRLRSLGRVAVSLPSFHRL